MNREDQPDEIYLDLLKTAAEVLSDPAKRKEYSMGTPVSFPPKIPLKPAIQETEQAANTSVSLVDKKQPLTARIKDVVALVNAARKLYRTFDRSGRLRLKDVIAAQIYYLRPNGYPTNKKFKEPDGRWAVNNHVYPRAKAALELLTAPKDVTVTEFEKNFKERYAVVTYITHEENKRIPHFHASNLDLMTSEELATKKNEKNQSEIPPI